MFDLKGILSKALILLLVIYQVSCNSDIENGDGLELVRKFGELCNQDHKCIAEMNKRLEKVLDSETQIEPKKPEPQGDS